MINRLRPRAAPIMQPPPQPVEPPSVSMPASPSPTDRQSTILGVNALMLTSLPPMASGADVYVRQFYGQSLPARRYLPLTGL